MPELSIIVPIYNVEKYLSNCIESILNQTFRDFELILLTDFPTDRSAKICEEYANGDSSTEWGAECAENGHKEPFNLEFIAIGNENWGEQYFNNFKAIKAAIEKVYPEMTIITASGTLSEGAVFVYAWDTIHKRYPDTYVDEHYYNSPEWFLENTDRYDSYRRDSAKVFVGEFAAHEKGETNNTSELLIYSFSRGSLFNWHRT